MGNTIPRNQELETLTRTVANARIRYDVPPDDSQIRSIHLHITGNVNYSVNGSATPEPSPENFVQAVRWIFQGKIISEARGDMLRDLHIKMFKREPTRVVPGFTGATNPFEINLVMPFANVDGWKAMDTFFDARGLTKNLQLEVLFGTVDDLGTGGTKTYTADTTPIIEYEEDLIRLPDQSRNVGTRLVEFQRNVISAVANDGFRLDIDQGKYNLLIVRVRNNTLVRSNALVTHFRLEGSVPRKGFKEFEMRSYAAARGRQPSIIGAIDAIRPGTLYLIPNPDGNIREFYPFSNATNARFRATTIAPTGTADITILARQILDPEEDLGLSGRRKFAT